MSRPSWTRALVTVIGGAGLTAAALQLPGSLQLAQASGTATADPTASQVAVRLALDARRFLGALVPTLGFLTLGILWGLDEAPLAAVLGAGYGAVALLWALWRSLQERRTVSEEVIAGPVAGRGVVTLLHADGRTTTYEPVTPEVGVGESVRAGQVIGRLHEGAGHCGEIPSCLHWGLRDGEDYLDPMSLLRRGRPSLLPWTP